MDNGRPLSLPTAGCLLRHHAPPSRQGGAGGGEEDGCHDADGPGGQGGAGGGDDGGQQYDQGGQDWPSSRAAQGEDVGQVQEGQG